MTAVLIRSGGLRRKDSEEGHVMTEAENGVRQLEAKECQHCRQPPEVDKN